jgi:hypothetical protein
MLFFLWYASADPNKRGKQYIFSDLALKPSIFNCYVYISETSMFRYKTLISGNLSFRNFAPEENEVMSGINIINVSSMKNKFSKFR